jgi:DnaJ-domain-containing protein 1
LPYSGKKQPDDPGVAVYFRLGKKDRVLACDRWDKVIDNLWAISKHIDSMRGQMRWGVGSIDQAFAGYQALPPANAKEWWQVLGVHPNATLEDVKVAYRSLAKLAHPDRGGSQARMTELNLAMQEAERIYQSSAPGR